MPPGAPLTPHGGRRGALLLPGLVLVLATCAAYVPALSAGYVWDDPEYVTHNPVLRAPGGLAAIWLDPSATPQYYPLVHTSFWIEHRLWGLAPAGYHAVNVLLHGLCAVLIWRLLANLGLTGAWLAAALFALHPVHVESVAWITERKNVLSGALYLGAALLLWRFRFGRADKGPAGRRAGLYAAALVLFAAALLSKSVTASLPVAFLIAVWWKEGHLRVADALAAAPLLTLGAVAGWNTARLERAVVGAAGPEWDFSVVERCLIAGRALWFYLGKLAWPHPLVFSYPRWTIDAGSWWQWLFPAAAAGLTAMLFVQRRRLGRGPLAAWLFFAVTLSPALGFFDVYPMLFSFVADHFQYLASIGPLAVLAVAIARRLPRPAALAISVVLLATFAGLTWSRAGDYRDAETLWRDTIRRNPASWLAHGNLASALLEEGRVVEAIVHYEQALTLNSRFPTIHFGLSEAYERTGRIDEALAHARRGVEAMPGSPEAHANLARLLAATGRVDDAMRHYRRANRLAPGRPDTLTALAWLIATHPDPAARDAARAIRLAERAVRSSPAPAAAAYDTLAAAYAAAGRFEEAAAAAERALALLDPGDHDDPAREEIALRLAGYREGRAVVSLVVSPEDAAPAGPP